jgi:GDP-4-dehydro-6-deoxy-D-mannose reductase
MRALILGIDSPLGKNLAEELVAKGYDVTGISSRQISAQNLPKGIKFFKLDLSKASDVLYLFDRISPHTIFHLELTHDEDDDLKQKNVENTKNVLDAAEELDKTAVLLLSSYSVYGKPKIVPLSEDHPLLASTEVGKSFVLAENLAKDSAKKGFRVIITRAFYYVPDGNLENIKGHQKIDIIDAKDLAKALTVAAEKGDPGDPYNVCSGNAYEFDSKKKIVRAKIDNTCIVGDNRKFFRKTGWRPLIDVVGN